MWFKEDYALLSWIWPMHMQQAVACDTEPMRKKKFSAASPILCWDFLKQKKEERFPFQKRGEFSFRMLLFSAPIPMKIINF